MPTNQELITENASQRKVISRQQLLISQMRATINRVRTTRIAMVAGQNVDQVNPAAEAAKVEELMAQADPEFGLLLAILKFYADPLNYRTAGIPSLTSKVMADLGTKAREALKKIT